MKHEEKLEKILNKLCNELVEFFESGFVVVTYKEADETKNAFIKFGNDYTIDGLISNIHDIMYGQEEDDEEEDDDDDGGDLKNVLKKTLE
jgi:hypothetical protein